jgi:hypothetical protein
MRRCFYFPKSIRPSIFDIAFPGPVEPDRHNTYALAEFVERFCLARLNRLGNGAYRGVVLILI